LCWKPRSWKKQKLSMNLSENFVPESGYFFKKSRSFGCEDLVLMNRQRSVGYERGVKYTKQGLSGTKAIWELILVYWPKKSKYWLTEDLEIPHPQYSVAITRLLAGVVIINLTARVSFFFLLILSFVFRKSRVFPKLCGV